MVVVVVMVAIVVAVVADCGRGSRGYGCDFSCGCGWL